MENYSYGIMTKRGVLIWHGQAQEIFKDQGDTGEKGDTGDKGDAFKYEDFTEEQLAGLTGATGVTGDPFTIYRTYESVESMNADAVNVPEGAFVAIQSSVEEEANAQLYLKGANSFTFIMDMSGATGLKGDTGAKGDAGTLVLPVQLVRKVILEMKDRKV